MRTYLRVMKAAADGTRTKILKMLQHRELCVCEMQAVLGVSQPSVSRHLRILEDADLVRGEKNGMWTNFRLAKTDETNQYARTVLANLRQWLENDPEILNLFEQVRTVDRSTCAKM
ncbi:MAG: winged helix-turn-helix transcriptional regulator [Deltaproteobacteria bacterium]|nr:winged helix-turn-helix transcriptional regulator [Deltaproteobacteria bacterium]MBW2072243.1 winged helix-turn-helix transcriptional regulator [Deltaproteobacteria bacterium]